MIKFISENKTPLKPLDFNDIKTEDFLIESPDTCSFLPMSPQKTSLNTTSTSPILNKNSFTRVKRKTSPRSPFLFPQIASKTPKPETPKCDDSNIMECSIIEDTPVLKSRKRPKISMAQRHKNKKGQDTTLTQMFLAPKKTK